MTLHEKVVLSAYTGILMCDMAEVHKYIEKLLDRPVWTHELASETLWAQIKDKAKPDFLKSSNHRRPSMEKVKPKAVLYLCDRKRCGDRCHHPVCRHTTDISHAVHGGAFPNGYEKIPYENGICFVEKEG